MAFQSRFQCDFFLLKGKKHRISCYLAQVSRAIKISFENLVDNLLDIAKSKHQCLYLVGGYLIWTYLIIYVWSQVIKASHYAANIAMLLLKQICPWLLNFRFKPPCSNIPMCSYHLQYVCTNPYNHFINMCFFSLTFVGY